MPETLITRIFSLAQERAEHIALAFRKQTLSYAELAEKIRTIGSSLVRMGICPGDRVLLSAVSKPETAAAYLAIQYAGAVAVFVDKNASAESVCYYYEDTGAALYLTDKPFRGMEQYRTFSLKALFAEPGGAPAYTYRQPEEDALAEMIYTSGTTGVPKGVMLSYRAVRTIWTNTILGADMHPDDCVLLPLPLNHSFALRVLRAGLYLGATVVLQNGFTFAREIENNLDQYRCTSIAIVPASVETIARQMQDQFVPVMRRFRRIEVSAGSLSVEQRKRLVKQLPDTAIVNTWGSSESGGALFLQVNEAVRDEKLTAALGKPLAGVEVITLDEQGNAFESDREHPGRMALRGDMQMTGYWNKPEATAQTLRGGWLLTGDMIYVEDGYVFMLGRADDIINVGGEKVSPIEVENAAGEYEDLTECACIGVPDPEGVLGFVPALFVVPKSGFSERELSAFLAQKLERYKIPAVYVKLVELPRNKMQKIDRKALKLIWENRDQMRLYNETVQLIMTRRSVRRFRDEKIDRDILALLVKAGRFAPSGHNMQTWHFTVIDNARRIQELKEAAGKTAKENGVYFYGFENPAALILISNDERNHYGCQDASCASENVMLAAWSLGIGSVWLNPLMTLRKKEPVKSLLDSYGIPENHIVWSMLALGYPLSEGVLLKKNENVVTWID